MGDYAEQGPERRSSPGGFHASPATSRRRALFQGPGGRPVGSVPGELFWKYAGEDHVIDARDLRDLLKEIAKQGKNYVLGIVFVFMCAFVFCLYVCLSVVLRV